MSSGESTVLVGSIVSNHTAPSLETRGKTYYNLRNTLTKDGIIAEVCLQKTMSSGHLPLHQQSF